MDVDKCAVLEKAEMPDPNAYTLEIDHFSECILRGQAPLRTLVAIRTTATVLDALARSAREGLSVGVA
ncbi:MAG: hypothetical protein A3K19_28505 [Lentisphaerae bacterium RIFOXYB12_FULL_65_16]|nr:MAG: hypothetical protein A3K18_19755 [Lentisphaerae bacterium RIFOXYA12_64_32]OGV85528.1 MAG: hypothetical protein A3K19_28505 [Lentisphaerae bacterium RIFOXYB12_FULL_65_16]